MLKEEEMNTAHLSHLQSQFLPPHADDQRQSYSVGAMEQNQMLLLNKKQLDYCTNVIAPCLTQMPKAWAFMAPLDTNRKVWVA